MYFIKSFELYNTASPKISAASGRKHGGNVRTVAIRSNKRGIKRNQRIRHNNKNLSSKFDYHINSKGCAGIKVFMLYKFLINFSRLLFLLNNLENTV